MRSASQSLPLVTQDLTDDSFVMVTAEGRGGDDDGLTGDAPGSNRPRYQAVRYFVKING